MHSILSHRRLSRSVEWRSGTASETRTANGANKRLVLHVRLRCGSMSITTPVSLLANEFDVRSVLHGSRAWQLSIKFVKIIGIWTVAKILRYIKEWLRKCKYNNFFLHFIFKPSLMMSNAMPRLKWVQTMRYINNNINMSSMNVFLPVFQHQL